MTNVENWNIISTQNDDETKIKLKFETKFKLSSLMQL